MSQNHLLLFLANFRHSHGSLLLPSHLLRSPDPRHYLSLYPSLAVSVSPAPASAARHARLHGASAVVAQVPYGYLPPVCTPVLATGLARRNRSGPAHHPWTGQRG